NGDSDHSWGQFLVDEKMVDAQTYEIQNNHFFAQYKAGTLDIFEYLAFSLKPLTQHPLPVMLQARARFLQECIVPIISQKSRDLIAKHQDLGDTLLIITATNGFVTYPIAQLLKIEHIIAPHPEVVDGAYTGRIVGIPSFQHGKVERLHAWLHEHQQNLAGSWFYSDSHNDLPLLEQVEHAVAVDPDATLLAIAQERHWPIISLKD
ncbi:MAG: hypothetical protein RL217_889, partial [Pseudomonadota bacterium]